MAQKCVDNLQLEYCKLVDKMENNAKQSSKALSDCISTCSLKVGEIQTKMLKEEQIKSLVDKRLDVVQD